MLLNQRISILYFLNTIKTDIAIIIGFSIIIGAFDQYGFLEDISIPIGVTAIFGTAVALLLAFRTNQAYDRWWEARIIWGAIVNDSRTLVRQSLSFFDRTQAGHEAMVREIALRQIIWCYALGESLRNQAFSQKVTAYINSNQIDASNIPNALLSSHSETLRKAKLSNLVNDFQQVQIDSTIARLCDAMGKCERIKNTVFPKAHSMLIHTIIYVFAAMIPFGLFDKYLIVETVITIGIPVIFIAIEKTSMLMQDPFENEPLDTPMTDLAQTIEINLKEMIGETHIPVKREPEDYFVL